MFLINNIKKIFCIVIIFILVSPFFLLVFGEIYVENLLNNSKKLKSSHKLALIRKYYNEYCFDLFEPKIRKRNKLKYIPEINYYFRPDNTHFVGREFEFDVHLNELGFRDNSISLIQPEIAFLGDSFTFGWGVGQDKIFSEIIEKECKKRVINLSLPDIASAKKLYMLRNIDYSELKYIFFQYSEDDFLENKAVIENGYLAFFEKINYHSSKPIYPFKQQYFPFKHLLTYYKLNKIKNLNAQNPYKNYLKKIISENINSEIHYLLTIINSISQKAKKANFFLFEINGYNRNSSTLIKKIQSKLKKNNNSFLASIQTLDFSKILTNEHYFILDKHLNEKGHRLIANKLKKNIKN